MKFKLLPAKDLRHIIDVNAKAADYERRLALMRNLAIKARELLIQMENPNVLGPIFSAIYRDACGSISIEAIRRYFQLVFGRHGYGVEIYERTPEVFTICIIAG